MVCEAPQGVQVLPARQARTGRRARTELRVQAVRPAAVRRGRDGYLRVFYDRLGVKFETYDAWVAAGGRMPVTLAH